MTDSSLPFTPERLLQEIDWVRALALRLVCDANEADDLAQETLLAALRTRPPPARGLRAWLARVLRNQAVSRYRAGIRRKRRETRVAPNERLPSASEALERAELQRKLVNAVFTLEEPYRRTVLLVYFEGLDAARIAAEEKVSPVTVRTRLKRGLDQLRSKFDADFGERRKWQLALLPLADLRPAGPVPGAVPAGGNLAGLVTGGLMSAKKVAAALVATLLLLWAGFVYFEHSTPLGTDRSAVQVSSRPAPVAAPARRDLPQRTSMEIETAGALPPPVDLDSADRDLDLFGIVIDGSGAPIAGANVEVVRNPVRSLHLPAGSLRAEEAAGGQKTRAAADGTFLLRLSWGELVDLRVAHPGFGQRELTARMAGEFVEVVLARAAQLQVAVRNEEGRPASQARLEIALSDVSRGGRSCDFREGMTDAEGRFLFSDLQPGSWTLGFSHLGGYEYQKVEIVEGETARVEVTTRAGQALRGRVIDAETGEPIAGARVGAYFSLAGAVLTGRDGRYTFPGWTREGAWDLHVVAQGYGRRNEKVLDPAEELDFELSPACEATGLVVGSKGQPVAGALVAAIASRLREDGLQELDCQSSTTAVDGRFRLTGLRADLPQTLLLHSDGHGKYLLDFDHRLSEDGGMDLGIVELPEGRRIEGVALDGGGNPIAGAGVELIGHNEDRGRLRPGPPWAIDGMSGQLERRWTDDLGRFRFRDLSPGQYHLTLLAPGAGRLERPVVLSAGQDVLDLVLGSKSGRSLRVLVKDGSGTGIPGISIEATWSPETKQRGRGLARLKVRTDSEGRAVIHGLAASNVRIALDEDHEHEYLPPNERFRIVTPAGQEIVYVLEKGAFLDGTVLSPEGDPLPWLQVIAKSPSGGEEITATYSGPDGAFRIKLRGGIPADLSVTGLRSNPGMPDGERTSPFRGELRGVTAPASGITIRTHRVP